MSYETPPSGPHFDAALGWLERRKRVLLVRNGRVEGSELTPRWDLPGGRAQSQELLTQALEREWREETGLRVRPGPLLLTVDGRRVRRKRVMYAWRAFLFRVHVKGNPSPMAGEGIDELRWVGRDEVARYLDAPYHAALRRWITVDSSTRYDTVLWTDDDHERTPLELHRLMRVAALGAMGHMDELEDELVDAQAADIPLERIEESLLQLVPFAGVPRTLAAFTVLRSLGSRPELDSEENPNETLNRRTRGRRTFDAVYGDRAGNILGKIRRLHPELPDVVLDDAYGRILSRDHWLTLVERELLAIAILGSLGSLEAPLLGHMRAARSLGATQEAVAAAVACIPLTQGPERSRHARKLLARL